MTQNMIKHARAKNLVRFQRSVMKALTERIPAIIQNERERVADILFNRRSPK